MFSFRRKMSDSKPKKDEKTTGGDKGTNSGAQMPESGNPIDKLQSFLKEKLHISDPSEPLQVLPELNLSGVASYIKSGKCSNIITLAGAGISTSAGIPDFRSPGSGLYHNLERYNLPHPQAIFELDYFIDNPKPFFVLAKELYPGLFKPTVCHYFIKMLYEKQLLLRHYTQNIDTLERAAGIPGEKLVEAHGTFHTGHCLGCHKEYTMEWMKEQIFRDKIPACDVCKGVVKPDIIFFGENLPEKFHDCLTKDFPKCDLLIIMGSSLAVQPFASLVDRVSDTCPRILINREKTGHRGGLLVMLGYKEGMDFDSDENFRDVCWLGNCDDGCQLLADKLGWGDELKKLVKSEHARIDKKNAEQKEKTKKAGEESKPKADKKAK